jgi:hypothetical protein
LIYPFFGVISLIGLYIVYWCGGTHVVEAEKDELELQEKTDDSEKELPYIS